MVLNVYKFLAFIFLALSMHGETALQKNNIKQYVVDNLDTLKNLVKRKDKTKASFDLREIFSSYAEDANSLLAELDATEDCSSENTKQEMIEQIAKHMEVLQKLLNIMNHEMPSMEFHRFCQSNEPFHDAICRRPVKKIIKKHDDLKPGKITGVKRKYEEDDLTELGVIN